MGIILSFCEFWLPFQDLTNCSLDLPSGSLFAQKHLWNGVMVVIKIVPGVWVWCWGPKPLNSSTLEFLLGNQVKFSCFLFGGVVTVISTSLLSSWSICYAGGLFWRPLGLLNEVVSNRASRSFCFLYRLWPAALDAVLILSAGPGPPVVNGIFEVCHWTWASFLTNPSRRPLLCLSVFCPRAAGSESLKCFLFHSPTLGNFWKIFFKMSVCSRSVFMKICWKVATLGVLNSLSPAVFFLWLYYITALGFRLFADRTSFICNICA